MKENYSDNLYCPYHNKLLVVRIAKKGIHRGQMFLIRSVDIHEILLKVKD